MSTPRSLRTARRRTTAVVAGLAAAGALGAVLLAPPASALAAAPGAGLVGAVCDQGGSLLHLENPGAAPAEFTVTVDGDAARVVLVPAGAAHDEVVPLADGTEATVVVSAPGMASLTATVVQDCAAAAGHVVEADATPLRLIASHVALAGGTNPVVVALLHLVLAFFVRALVVRRRFAR